MGGRAGGWESSAKRVKWVFSEDGRASRHVTGTRHITSASHALTANAVVNHTRDGVTLHSG